MLRAVELLAAAARETVVRFGWWPVRALEHNCPPPRPATRYGAKDRHARHAASGSRQALRSRRSHRSAPAPPEGRPPWRLLPPGSATRWERAAGPREDHRVGQSDASRYRLPEIGRAS